MPPPKNIFVPMYAQTGFDGRLTSFIMRVANIIVRSFGLLIWTCIVGIAFCVWLALPLFVVYMLFISLIQA